jgi:hypothetical protein
MNRLGSTAPTLNAATATNIEPASKPRILSFARIPRELFNIIVVSVGLFAAIHVGDRIADAIQADTPWLSMLCYTAPIAVVSAIFWLVGRIL